MPEERPVKHKQYGLIVRGQFRKTSKKEIALFVGRAIEDLESKMADKIQEAQALIGAAVDVKFNVQARQYNGRWYTDLGLRFISAAVTERPALQPKPAPAPAPQPQHAQEDDPDGDLPF